MEAGGHRGTQLENRERGGKTVSVGYIHLISKLKRLTGLLNAQPRGRKGENLQTFPLPLYHRRRDAVNILLRQDDTSCTFEDTLGEVGGGGEKSSAGELSLYYVAH